jgi:hypothetical protein
VVVVKCLDGLVRFDLELECLAGLGVRHRGQHLVLGLVPEQANVDRVAAASIELSGRAPGAE